MKRQVVRIFATAFLMIFFSIQVLSAGTHTVTTTADSGVGSLRQAIIDANADGTAPRIINFAIASGIQVITPVTALPSLTASDIIIDGSTQPGWSANSPQIILDGPGTFAFDALTVDGVDRCTIQDLVINNGFNAGINIINGASNTEIYGCFLGTNQAGSAASGLGVGISMAALGADVSSNTIIGAPGRGNISSGNGAGMFLGGNLTDTLIQSNLIGTDITGSIAILNMQVGIAILIMPGSDLVTAVNTQIGGLATGEGNVISGNGDGGMNFAPGIFMGFQQVTGTIIQGNKLGVNSVGSAALPNDFGILTFIPPGQTATIDGTIIENNIISGNRGDGILLQFPVHNSVVKGNFIGTDSSGTIALPNGNNGIGALNGDDNIIGGSTAADRNIISGNTGSGILLQQATNDVVIQGNYIGVDSTGIVALANGNNGIEIQGSDIDASNGALIGGSLAGQGNVIGGNTGSGILFRSNVNNSIIRGNFIGTDSTATVDLGNGGEGILIDSQFTGTLASVNNTIGGLNLADHNTIKFNNFGISIGGGSDASPDILNPILGNSIFANTNNGINLFDGGNNLQESPVVTEALLCPTNNVLYITATAPANPAASNFRLEFFVNSVDNSPITEGELFIGAMEMVASGASMSQAFTVPGTVAVGQWVSATATNFNNMGNTLGDTSEFSLNFEIQAAVAPVVSLSATPPLLYGGDSTTLTATFSGTGPFSAQWSDGLVQPGVVSPLMRVVTPAATTNYSVTITDAQGCVTTASALVTVFQVSPLVRALVDKYC